MSERGITTNTFDGGIDLDSDNKAISSNKYREAYNVDIRKSGNVFSLVDLKGERIIAEIESTEEYNVHVLNVTDANFLTVPTNSSERCLVVFYCRSKEGVNEFLIKIVFLSDFRVITFFSEEVNQDDYEKLSVSSIDVETVGQYGYDVIYFVDNVRQPRRIELVSYTTNDQSLTIHLESIEDGFNYKTLTLKLSNSHTPKDSFRAYIYSFLSGNGSGIEPVNPLTESIKFIDFDASDIDRFISFNIYEQDYGSRVFQIRYHKEDDVYYRNFIIGDPSTVNVDLGIIDNPFTIMAGENVSPSVTHTGSWNFLYDGITVYCHTDEVPINIGFTKIYKSNVSSSLNLLRDGHYQAFNTPDENKFIRVQDGKIMEYRTNFANVEFSVIPQQISSQVRSLSPVITEGNFDRLSELSYSVPESVTVGSDEFELVGINTTTKSSNNSTLSYVMERDGDQYPKATYSSTDVYLSGYFTDIIDEGSGQYRMNSIATISRPVEYELSTTVRMRVLDSDQNEIEQVSSFITILPGETEGHQSIIYNQYSPITFGQVCVDGYNYGGSENIVPQSQCM